MTTSSSDRGRILIVDDDRKILDLLLDLLALEGYEVATAVDGSEAIDLALSFEPDIVVSDVVMPNVSGLELCRHLKEDPRTAFIPVMLISGLIPAGDGGIEGLHAGADDYIDLPFRNEELQVKVARLVERHRIEGALKESEERYRSLVELSPDAIVVHHEGKFTYVNPSAVKLWGASGPQELIGKSILDVVHPDYHDHVRERVDYILQFQKATELAEQKCLRLDGSELDIEVTGLPFTSEGQSAVLAVFRDVTEKKQAREALRKAEKRLRTVVASASLILFATDKNGVFTLCEGEGLKILSLQPGELVGQSAFEVYADSPQVGENIRRALQGEAFTAAVSVRDLFFDVRYSPLTDENENVLGVIGVATDITENRRAEISIRESEERYRELFENANDIIYTHDLRGNFTSLNRSGERITGYSREEAVRMNVADVIAPEYLGLAREMIAHKASEKVSTVYEIDIITKDGRRVRLEVSTRLIFSDGKPVGVQGIARDLTERKHSEEILRESQAFLAQQAQREAMTHRISQAIRCSLDSSEIYKTAVRELGSYLAVDRCSLFMRDERARCALNVAEYHVNGVEPAASDFALAHLQQLISALDQTGVLPFIDAAKDERIADLYQNILSKANVKSIMYVAIRVGDDVPAAFALSTTRHVRQWSEADIALAKAVADQTGIAIRQAELYQKAESTSIREALVNRLTMAIRASLSLGEVLSTATVELGRALATSRVHLFLLDSEGVSVPLEHEYLADGVKSIKHIDVDYDHPIARQLSSSNQPLIIDDAQNFVDESARLTDYVRAQAQRLEILSQINYPLIVKGQFRGILSIHQTDRRRLWMEDELTLVQALAERLSIGIAQAELFEMVARGKTEWETTFDAMSDGIFIFDRAGELKRVNRAGATRSEERRVGKECRAR